MRSRFAAFAAGDVAHLLATWHPSTRPTHLDLATTPSGGRCRSSTRSGEGRATSRASSSSAPPTATPTGAASSTSAPASSARAGSGSTSTARSSAEPRAHPPRYPGGMTERPASTRQVRPATEGWSQKLDSDGRPLLQFASTKRGKPPEHLADWTPAERAAKITDLGLPAFRAKQIATHYFTHYTSDPAVMTDCRRGSRRAGGRGPPAAAHRAPPPRDRPRRHDQVPLEAARRRARRVGADALPGPHHAVHLEPGRMRHELPVLRHRSGGAHPQPVDGRDRRPGGAGEPRHRRRAARRQEARRPLARARQQHRLHGDGGAARQLRARFSRRSARWSPRSRRGSV